MPIDLAGHVCTWCQGTGFFDDERGRPWPCVCGITVFVDFGADIEDCTVKVQEWGGIGRLVTPSYFLTGESDEKTLRGLVTGDSDVNV